MTGTGVIDHFLEIFTRYIDGGFGLLRGEVGFLATTLIAIDMTLVALFWAWGSEEDIIARLIRKTLFVGVFAWLISNWNSLARIVFDSFAGLGLKASGTGFAAADLLHPGKVAQTGLDAGRPLLESISNLMGYWSFFENFIQIACMLFAWLVVLLAFFILAIQLFVSLIEFKLTTLAGFVLIPFGLFGKSAFLAERVLGNVVSSGIKMLVLAVIIGIGSTLFAEFTSAGGTTTPPTIDQAMAMVLAALSLLGLGIFGPGIASGLVAGGPQLAAGSLAATGMVAGGSLMAGAAAVRAAATARQIAAAAAHTAAAAAGGTSAAYGLGAAGHSGLASVASGVASTVATATSAVVSPLRHLVAEAGDSLTDSYREGARAVAQLTGGGFTGRRSRSSSSSTPSSPLRTSREVLHGLQTASAGLQSADHAVSGAAIDLSQGNS
ncbi:MAG: P-type conjugative transfer protein TrbL [Alphaproteobacteria bacterium]|nr:P-type conjugative transfer protein TrbL [Alphaproteobacteria bacterium]